MAAHAVGVVVVGVVVVCCLVVRSAEFVLNGFGPGQRAVSQAKPSQPASQPTSQPANQPASTSTSVALVPSRTMKRCATIGLVGNSVTCALFLLLRLRLLLLSLLLFASHFQLRCGKLPGGPHQQQQQPGSA